MMKLAKNPAVQKMAKQAAMFAVTRVQGRIQARRNRPQQPRRLAPRRNAARTTQRQIPVRTAYRTGNNVKQGITVAQTECNLNITADDTANGEIYGDRIQPNLSAIWPLLANLAINYKSYRCTKLVFEYVPSSSTAVDGWCRMAWSNSVTCDFPSSAEDSLRWPIHQESNIFDRNIMTITPKDMNGLGAWLLCKDDSNQYESTPCLYQLGSFVIRTRRSDWSTPKNAGMLKTTYHFELKDKTTDEVEASTMAIATPTSIDILRSGMVSPQILSANSFRVYSNGPCMLMHYSKDEDIGVDLTTLPVGYITLFDYHNTLGGECFQLFWLPHFAATNSIKAAAHMNASHAYFVWRCKTLPDEVVTFFA